MRSRRAGALIADAGTGSAAMIAGSAHSSAVPVATSDHLRHAPRLTDGAASPLLPRNQSTSRCGPPRTDPALP